MSNPNDKESAEASGVASSALLGWQGVCFAPKTGEVFLLCLPRMMNLIVRCRYNTVHGSFQMDMEDDRKCSDGGVTRPYFPFYGGEINGKDHPGDMFMPMPKVPDCWPNNQGEAHPPAKNL